MSVIVVISIFVTLCTCTLVMWLRDVLRDYDTQRRRRAALQRRQVTTGAVVGNTQQQQQQQRQQSGGRPVVIPRPPHSATASPTEVPPPYPPSDEDRATPTPSEISVSTAAGIEDVTTSSQLGIVVAVLVPSLSPGTIDVLTCVLMTVSWYICTLFYTFRVSYRIWYVRDE